VGGVLEHSTREVTVEALPTDIPDEISLDVSTLEIGDSLTLASLSAPAAVRILGDPDTLIATVSAPRLQIEDETEIETETAVVGEGEAPETEAETGGASAGGESDGG